MKMSEGHKLLAEYARTGSEAAFRELVKSYVDLVYSSAVRLVNGDTHLAEDVSQTVFADLARMAKSLSSDVMLGGWLHRHTCFVASKTLRTERRRLERERQAVEMNTLEDHSSANLASVAPALDDAINQLSAEDRSAILLRFFEQHDFQSVGSALGVTEEAARKRVDRALDKLELTLKRRGIAFSAAALATTLATQAVSAAPVGLAASISTVVLSGAVAGSGATLTIINIMSMTKLKIGIATVVVAAGITVPLVMQHQTKTRLAAANQEIQSREAAIKQLAAENERLSNLVAQTAVARTTTPDSNANREVLKLRGEVGRLKQENIAVASARTNAPSALSGITANPEMFKLIREQQKGGMKMIYDDYAKKAKLGTNETARFADTLADHVMDNIKHITKMLQEGKSPEEMEAVFAAEQAALNQKIQELVGPEGLAQYQEYTKDLASTISAHQFKPQLTGDKAEKDTKANQIRDIMLEETRIALASAGLPADYQTVPTLNFINIASESIGERNLKLLDGIYERVATRLPSFLSADEIQKFGEFRTLAINNNRAGLLINRKMMMPGGR